MKNTILSFLSIIILSCTTAEKEGGSGSYVKPKEQPVHLTHDDADLGKIHSYLYLPDDEPKAVAVYLHGGPHLSFTKQTPKEFIQPFLDKGFAVLGVDYRGSRGYGDAYSNAIVGDIGGKEIEDVVTAIWELDKIDFLKKKKVFLYGHSYGGYLSLLVASKSQYPFAAVASLSGPTDMLEQFKLLNKCKSKSCRRAYQAMKKDAGGDHITNKDFLIERSPITYLKDLKIPTLLVHGAKDKYCPIKPILNYRRQAGKLKKNVKLKVYKTYGHGLGGPKNKEKTTKVFSFVAKYFMRFL